MSGEDGNGGNKVKKGQKAVEGYEAVETTKVSGSNTGVEPPAMVIIAEDTLVASTTMPCPGGDGG